MPDKCFSVTTDKGNMGIVHGNPEMSDESRAAIKAIVDAAVERIKDHPPVTLEAVERAMRG